MDGPFRKLGFLRADTANDEIHDSNTLGQA